MDIGSLHKRLDHWKHILFVDLGALTVLWLQALLHYQESHHLVFEADWYSVWFIVQLAALLPGFVLLWGKHWMQIPLSERLHTIFGYFAVAWLTLLPVGVRIGPDTSKSFNLFLLGCALAIGVGYWQLHRKAQGSPNEMFP
jgi:hypothetical protein